MVTAEQVKEKWSEILNSDERIMFIVGGPGSGKSKLIREIAAREGGCIVEAKELIDEEILEIPREERPAVAKRILCESLKACHNDLVLLDSVHVLFAPILNLDPVPLLKEVSKEYPLIVGWRGRYEDGQLYLEHNNNPDYFVCEVKHPHHVVTVD